MAAHHAQHPQAERQQPDRADLRARRRARLRGGRRLGQDERRPSSCAKDPAHLTPMLEEAGPAARLAVGELRDHAVPLQQARPRPVLPDRPGRAGDGRQRDVLPDRHALSARRARHLPGARLPAVRGRGRHVRRRRRARRRRRRQDAEAALAEPLDVYRAFFLDGKPFIGGDAPSIADIRLAATLEFLHAIDYEFPAWATEYMAAMEAALGDAYSEPAADVRGYIDVREVAAGVTRPERAVVTLRRCADTS